MAVFPGWKVNGANQSLCGQDWTVTLIAKHRNLSHKNVLSKEHAILCELSEPMLTVHWKVQPHFWQKMTSKQPDMSFSCVCSGQNQILPQRMANKEAIRQNNGVVTKWPFNLSTVPVRPQHCSTKGPSFNFCIATTMWHTESHWHLHTQVREQHTEYIYLLCQWKGYLLFECCCSNVLWGLPLTNGWLVCSPVALNCSAHMIALSFAFRQTAFSGSVFVARSLEI